MSHPGRLPLSSDVWDRLRGLAEGACPEDPDGWSVRHGIGPLLEEGGARDDAATLGESRHRTEMLWAAHAVHLQRCLAAFADAGVRVLVLKGAALALSHYAYPALRPMGDLDVLVAPADWRTATRVLEGLDWVVDDPAEHASAFAGPGGGRLELHVALTSCPGLFPIRFDDLYARARPLGGGFEGQRLGDEDTVVHLSLHAAFQHGFRARLGHYVDFERLLAGALEWNRLFDLAAGARALRPMAASLAVARALLGIRPPPAVERRLAAHVPKAVRRWLAAAATRPWQLLEGLHLARARWILAEGAGCRVRLVAGTLWPGRPDGSRGVSPWKALARGRRLLLQHLWHAR